MPTNTPVFDWQSYDENAAEKLYEFPIGTPVNPVEIPEKQAPTRFDLSDDPAKSQPLAFPVSKELKRDRVPYMTADGKYALVGDSYDGGVIHTGADSTVRPMPDPLGCCNPVEGSIMFCTFSGSDKGPAYYGLFDAASASWKVKIEKKIIGYDFVGSNGTTIISDAMGTVMYFVLDPHTLDPVCRTDLRGEVVSSQTDYAQTKSLVITQPWEERRDIYHFTIFDARTCEVISTHEQNFGKEVSLYFSPVRADTGWITWATPDEDEGEGQLIKISDSGDSFTVFETDAFIGCSVRQYNAARANRAPLEELWEFLIGGFVPSRDEYDDCFVSVQVEAPYLALETYDKVYIGDKAIDASFVVAATKDGAYALVFDNLAFDSQVVKVADGSVVRTDIKASSLPAYLDGHLFMLAEYGETEVFAIPTE